jgi:hypothetical protein
VASRTEAYRRLAREYLEIGRTFPIGERRTTLLQMAQVWQRLADEQNHAPDLDQVPAPPPASEQIRPVVQQHSRFSLRMTRRNRPPQLAASSYALRHRARLTHEAMVRRS